MKKLTEADLQVGDILVFENKDFSIIKLLDELQLDYDELDNAKRTHAAFYLLLYLIPWFDPGKEGANYKNIYHAAIWANIDLNRGGGAPNFQNRIVQAGRSGIVSAEMSSTLKEDTVKAIYVYRRKQRNDEFAKNINVATRSFYNDTSIPYAYETAWLLAVICSLRYTDGQIHKILADKLGKKVADLMVMFIRQLINDYNDEHQKEMVACSTLVAMIFKNAGYELHVGALRQNASIQIPKEFKLKTDLFSFYTSTQEKKLPSIKVSETVITPRQLAESTDVELVGYLTAE